MVSPARSSWVPRRLGPYQVVGELATGGMAQILLARAEHKPPDERVVVIKRILPHLRGDRAFVDMFRDEGRLVCAVDHPNIVNVESFDTQGDELYLVMEYLQGESLLGLMRRLRRFQETLPHALGAYLIAEACDGLHAAHELCDGDGRPLDLVHRDVSPHNIFVTYDGMVKVLDFGIAKAKNRVAHTDVGQLKGKFEYMSPEQCSGRRVDRRSDVYSLGICLYELTTGHRLFRRKSDLLTIKAITEEPITPPSSLQPDYPQALEEVVLKALERKPRRRFADCAEMRRALMRIAREGPGLRGPQRDYVSRLMGSIFHDRVEDKRNVVERVARGDEVKNLPVPEVDLQFKVPDLSEIIDNATTSTRKSERTRKAARPDSVIPERVGAVGARPLEPVIAAQRVVVSGRAGGATEGIEPPRLNRGGLPTPSRINVRAEVLDQIRQAPVSEAPAPGGTHATPSGGVLATPVAAPGVGRIRDPNVHADDLPSMTRLRPPRRRVHTGRSARGVLPLWVIALAAFCAAGFATYLVGLRAARSKPFVPAPVLQVDPLVVETAAALSPDSPIVSVRVTSKPSGADVFIGGELRGRTPLLVRLPRSPTAIPYRLNMEGYKHVRGTLVPMADAVLSVPLVERPTPPPPASVEEAPSSPRKARTRRRARRARRPRGH